MSTRRPNGNWFHDHLLTIVLFAAFFISWTLQLVFQVLHESHEAIVHGTSMEWGDTLVSFFKDTFENWQSEFLQLFAFVVASEWFIHRNSPQSRDGDDEMKEQLDRIEAKVNWLADDEEDTGPATPLSE